MSIRQSAPKRGARPDPIAAALAAIVHGDVDAQLVRDVLAGRVPCNPSDRELVAELRALAIHVGRHCGGLRVARTAPGHLAGPRAR